MEHGRDDPVRRVDGDGDVHLAEHLDLVSGHARVEQRMLAQRGRGELRDDRCDADPRFRAGVVQLPP